MACMVAEGRPGERDDQHRNRPTLGHYLIFLTCPLASMAVKFTQNTTPIAVVDGTKLYRYDWHDAVQHYLRYLKVATFVMQFRIGYIDEPNTAARLWPRVTTITLPGDILTTSIHIGNPLLHSSKGRIVQHFKAECTFRGDV